MFRRLWRWITHLWLKHEEKPMTPMVEEKEYELPTPTRYRTRKQRNKHTKGAFGKPRYLR